jgi:UDP-N-acetylmuramoyl-L-alanyl-D-glutamate--2,6-diaminopimelate ligase
MQLEALLTNIVEEASIPSIDITHLTSDSRQVVKGSLFFAVPGEKVDGHDFIEQAISQGAEAIIAQKMEEVSVPFFKVSDTRKTLAQVSACFHGYPAKDFYACGVTGTNGKTTITYLLELLFAQELTGVMGTVNIRYAGKVEEATHTTPDAVELEGSLARMRDAGVKMVAMEVSSHALEQSRAQGVDFDSAIFTNMTQDHLDYHGDMESYYQSKRKLFFEVLGASSKKNKLAVINLDDEYGQRLAEEVQPVCAIKTFSLHDKTADLYLLEAEYGIQETRAKFGYGKSVYELETNLLGAYNLQNILAACLVAEHRGQDLATCFAKMKDVSVPGRLERVLGKNVFVDYAHTPDALKNVLMALKKVMQTGKLFTVFGCGGDRDRGKRPLMAEAAATFADVVVITSDNPRMEDPAKIIEEAAVGIGQHKTMDQDCFIEVDRKQAMALAISKMQADDVLLVAGKGHEDYQIIGNKKIHFDDREELTKLIGEATWN